MMEDMWCILVSSRSHEAHLDVATQLEDEVGQDVAH